jgi:hypothetical protein
MEPAVRGPWIESPIITDRVRNVAFGSQPPKIPGRRRDLAVENPAAGNGIFGCWWVPCPGRGPAAATWPDYTNCSCYPWTFKPSKALGPSRPGATTEPGAWIMSIVPLDLERRCEQRWAARFSRVPQEHRDTPRQQQQAATGKEQGKTRQVGRRVRGPPLVVSSNHLAESVALPPIRGKASCPNLKAFRPPFHSLQLRAPLVRSARPG